MQAVLEVPSLTTPPPWPVPPHTPYSWLPLDGTRSAAETALFVAAVADHQAPDEPESAAERVIDGLLEAETLIVAGGLRLHDIATGATVVPGCCAGLEDWRDWVLVAAGESPWLGHNPSPRSEALPGHARVWPDGQAGPGVDVPWAAFPELLAQVHRDLAAFADRLAEWAARWGDRGAALVAKIDHDFAMTAPLEVPQR